MIGWSIVLEKPVLCTFWLQHGWGVGRDGRIIAKSGVEHRKENDRHQDAQQEGPPHEGKSMDHVGLGVEVA